MMDDWTDLLFTVCMAAFLYFAISGVMFTGIELEKAKTADGIKEVYDHYLLGQFLKMQVIVDGREMSVAEAVSYGKLDLIKKEAEELIVPLVGAEPVTLHILDDDNEVMSWHSSGYNTARQGGVVREAVRIEQAIPNVYGKSPMVYTVRMIRWTA